MALKEWMFAVHDSALGQYKMGKNTTGWLHVLTAGAATSPTVYTNERGSVALTSTATSAGVLANTIAVVNITNGFCQFWLDSSITSIDLSYLTATGESGLAIGVTPNTQHILAVNSQAASYRLIVPFAFSVAETETTLELAEGLAFTQAQLHVVTVDATETMDVGLLSTETGGDADGLIAAASVATVGRAGSLAAVGLALRTDGVAKTITYTGSAGSDTAAGFISLGYHKLLG